MPLTVRAALFLRFFDVAPHRPLADRRSPNRYGRFMILGIGTGSSWGLDAELAITITPVAAAASMPVSWIAIIVF